MFGVALLLIVGGGGSGRKDQKMSPLFPLGGGDLRINWPD